MKTQANRIHTPVLLQETLNGLNVKPTGIYVDCTAGFGGHSSQIAKQLTSGQLICIDQDINAIKHLNTLFKSTKNVSIVKSNFENIDQIVKKPVDGIMMDLGVSSLMFDDPKRGFSYKNDGPLDMRMDNQSTLTASHIINTYTRAQLINIFKEFGEVSNPIKVVNQIIAQRDNNPIETTKQLSDLIEKCYPGSIIRKHPAKVYFQALRIEVNRELKVLKTALNKATNLLKKHGRLCVITFHSLEDRIVKQYFKQLTQPVDLYGKDVPITKVIKPQFKLITKKPILPTLQEIEANKRSHSAKLRIIERI